MIGPESPADTQELYDQWFLEAGSRKTAVTKLAFMDCSPNFVDDSVMKAVVAGDVEAVEASIWTESTLRGREDFLRQTARIAGLRGEFRRFHAVSTGRQGGGGESVLPNIHEPYMQFLAVHLSHYNVRYGGERIDIVPEAFARVAGMLALGSEMTVFQVGNQLKGVFGVEYTDLGEVERRRFYPAEHPVAQQSQAVVRSLRTALGTGRAAKDYRLAGVRPPEEFEQILESRGLHPFDGPVQEMTSLVAILPAAFRQRKQ